MYQFPEAILGILDEYKERQARLFNPISDAFTMQKWADLRLEFHAKVVTPYHEEFLAEVYRQCFDSIDTTKPRHTILALIPQLGDQDRDMILEELMFLDHDSRENYELRIRLVEGLKEMDFYQDKELPVQVLSDNTQKIRRAMII